MHRVQHPIRRRDRLHRRDKLPLPHVALAEFQPNFSLTRAASLPALVGGVGDDDLRDAVHDGGVSRAHTAVMQDHVQVREDVRVIDPG